MPPAIKKNIDAIRDAAISINNPDYRRERRVEWLREAEAEIQREIRVAELGKRLNTA